MCIFLVRFKLFAKSLASTVISRGSDNSTLLTNTVRGKIISEYPWSLALFGAPLEQIRKVKTRV